jgi:hypothetical protein
VAALEGKASAPLAERVRFFSAAIASAKLLRRTLGAMLVYAATVADEIAESIDDVDRAMRWGSAGSSGRLKRGTPSAFERS